MSSSHEPESGDLVTHTNIREAMGLAFDEYERLLDLVCLIAAEHFPILRPREDSDAEFQAAVTAIQRKVRSFDRYDSGWPIKYMLRAQLVELRRQLERHLERDAQICAESQRRSAEPPTPKRLASLIAEPEEQPTPPKRSRTLDEVGTEVAAFNLDDFNTLYEPDYSAEGQELRTNAVDDLFAGLDMGAPTEGSLEANLGVNAVDDLFSDLDLTSFGPASQGPTEVDQLFLGLCSGAEAENYSWQEFPRDPPMPLLNKEGGLDCPVEGCSDSLQSPLPLKIAVFIAQHLDLALNASAAGWLCDEIKTAQLYLSIAEERHYLPGLVLDEADLARYCGEWVCLELPHILQQLRGPAGPENAVVDRFLEGVGHSFWNYTKAEVKMLRKCGLPWPTKRPRGGPTFSAREAVEFILAPLASVSYFQDTLEISAEDAFSVLTGSAEFGSYYHGSDNEDEPTNTDVEADRSLSPDDNHEQSYESQYPLAPVSDDDNALEGTLRCLQCSNPPASSELTRCNICSADSHTVCLGFTIPPKKRALQFICGNCLPEEPPRADNIARRTRTSKTLYVLPAERKWKASTLWLPAQLISHHRSRVGSEYEFAWVPGAVNPSSKQPCLRTKLSFWSAKDLACFPTALAEIQLGYVELPCALKTDAELNQDPIAAKLKEVCLAAVPQVKAILNADNSKNRVVIHYDEYFRAAAAAPSPPSDSDWLKEVRLSPSTGARSVLEPIIQGIVTQHNQMSRSERPGRARSISYVLLQCLGMQHAVGEVFDLDGHTFDLWRSGSIVARSFKTAVQGLELMGSVVDSVKATLQFEAQRQEQARWCAVG
ncbi:hypothetical protein MKEN_01096200 [Mycena kentingensis (nom. inval.)]|nr:hypothetical protein MKEN_01096200 [Mycena kentingensis (nom. inval.)]